MRFLFYSLIVLLFFTGCFGPPEEDAQPADPAGPESPADPEGAPNEEPASPVLEEGGGQPEPAGPESPVDPEGALNEEPASPASEEEGQPEPAAPAEAPPALTEREETAGDAQPETSPAPAESDETPDEEPALPASEEGGGQPEPAAPAEAPPALTEREETAGDAQPETSPALDESDETPDEKPASPASEEEGQPEPAAPVVQKPSAAAEEDRKKDSQGDPAGNENLNQSSSSTSTLPVSQNTQERSFLSVALNKGKTVLSAVDNTAKSFWLWMVGEALSSSRTSQINQQRVFDAPANQGQSSPAVQRPSPAVQEQPSPANQGQSSPAVQEQPSPAAQRQQFHQTQLFYFTSDEGFSFIGFQQQLSHGGAAFLLIENERATENIITNGHDPGSASSFSFQMEFIQKFVEQPVIFAGSMCRAMESQEEFIDRPGYLVFLQDDQVESHPFSMNVILSLYGIGDVETDQQNGEVQKVVLARQAPNDVLPETYTLFRQESFEASPADNLHFEDGFLESYINALDSFLQDSRCSL